MPDPVCQDILTRAGSGEACPLCQTRCDCRFIPAVSSPDNRFCFNCGLVFQAGIASFDLNECYTKDGYWNKKTVSLSRFSRLLLLDDIRRGGPRLKKIEALLGKRLNSEDRILDIGSGYGGLLYQLQKKRGARVEGIEPSDLCGRLSRELLGLKVSSSMFENAKLRGNFGLITALHTLEHVADPLGFLVATRKLLTPDGLLYLEVPNLLAPSAGFPLKRFFEPAHLFNFTLASLGQYLARAGFSILASESQDFIRILAKPDRVKSNATSQDARPVLEFLKNYFYAEASPLNRLRPWLLRFSYLIKLAIYPLSCPILSLKILLRPSPKKISGESN